VNDGGRFDTTARAAAARYAAAYAAKPTTRPISPARFLRERCLDGYGPPAAAGKAQVFHPAGLASVARVDGAQGPPDPLEAGGNRLAFPERMAARGGARGVKIR
jgi:hypothetical protein